MKKHILIILAVVVCMALSSPVFAAVTISTSSTTQIAGANFVPSTNVTLKAISDTKNYCATSAHAQALGNSAGREWATTTAAASAMYYKQPAPATQDACTDALTIPTGMTAQ